MLHGCIVLNVGGGEGGGRGGTACRLSMLSNIYAHAK